MIGHTGRLYSTFLPPAVFHPQEPFMGPLHSTIDFFLHFNAHLNNFAGLHPVAVYGMLALIVFVETGLVVMPFLPGDSLLFAVGALAAAPNSPISLPLVMVLLCLSANCGDLVNYFVGKTFGEKVPFLSKKHLAEAHAFYARHGRKTIIMARFVPIIRTFAPFVAGVGEMTFPRFIGFSVLGGILWVVLVSLAGYFFGTIPAVASHFELVVVGIIAVSLIPIVVSAVTSGGKTAEPATPVAE
jgi:membrane-associated protein